MGERCVCTPSLVVVPASVSANWAIEFRQWAPKLKVIEYFGPKDERDAIFRKQVGRNFSQNIGLMGSTLATCSEEHPPQAHAE